MMEKKIEHVDISIIIATYNRCDRLDRMFDAFEKNSIPPDICWELLIIDNASTDNTATIINEKKKTTTLPIKYLYEKRKGKSNAVNLGLSIAKGSLIIFMDDDVEPAPGFISGYWKAACNYPDFDGFANRLLPSWNGPIPSWYQKHCDIGVIFSLEHQWNLGVEVRSLNSGMVPGGSNSALRRNAVTKMGFLRTDFGPGTKNPWAEDIEYMKRLLKLGGRFIYVPDALSYHRNDVERLTKKYALDWVKDSARCQVLANLTSETSSRFIGVPRYLWREIITRIFLWTIEVSSDKRFRKKVRLMQTWGSIKGYLQRVNLSKK